MRRLTQVGTLAVMAQIVFAMTAAAQATSANAVKWGPAPPFLPKGAKFAVMAGDPGKSGEFTIRLSLPPNYRIMPHWHPGDENVTVLSGTMNVGMGDKFDAKKGTAFHAGGFGSLPAKSHHYAWSTGKTVIQVHGVGPFVLNYINPADAPK